MGPPGSHDLGGFFASMGPRLINRGNAGKVEAFFDYWALQWGRG